MSGSERARAPAGCFTVSAGINFLKDGPCAAAMALVLLAVSFAVTLLILINSRRWVHYGGAVR